MSDIYNEFQKENNEILRYILEDKFFSKFTEEKLDFQRNKGLLVEFFVTSVCNQNCEYCYLARHGDELYPKEFRNIDTILNNEKIVLEYFLDRNFCISELDLFSGEIWGMKFGNEVLNIILEYVKKGLNIKSVMIPSNCSFVLNDNSLKIMQAYIDEFRKYKTELKFSASVEGKYLEDKTRPYNNSNINERKKSDEFYSKLFNFCVKNSYGFHPMVSAFGIEDWIDNFDWWISMLKKYRLDIFNFTMFLEVRNNDWTDDKIRKYLSFLNHVFDYFFLEHYENDAEKMINNTILKFTDGPQNYDLSQICISSKNPSCTIGRSLNIRLGDLSIVPCHRLSYDKFLYGNFKVEDNKIVGVNAKNIQLANKMYYTSVKACHRCDSCEYNLFCMRGCFGSQFETTKDPLLPCDTVCNFFMQKINFVIYKYKTSGVLDALKKISVKEKDTKRGVYAASFYNNIDKIRNRKEYIEWEKKIIKTL